MNALLFLEGDRLFYKKKIHCLGHVKTNSTVRSGPREGGDRLSLTLVPGRTTTMVYTSRLDFDIPVSYHNSKLT